MNLEDTVTILRSLSSGGLSYRTLYKFSYSHFFTKHLYGLDTDKNIHAVFINKRNFSQWLIYYN